MLYDLNVLITSSFKNISDASKAAFTASPSSCFLATRNKSSVLSGDSAVKDETHAEHPYMSLSGSQQGLGANVVVYQGTDPDGFPLSGTKDPLWSLHLISGFRIIRITQNIIAAYLQIAFIKMA